MGRDVGAASGEPSVRDLGEFALIERIAKVTRRAMPLPEGVVGIGDDAALLRLRVREDVVVSADTFVEDVHFRWRNESARTIGRRALVANLSDLAAMGARPLGFTLALAVPGHLSLRRVDAVLAGLLDEARRYTCPLVGGNVTRARETHLAITVIGAVERGRALRRRRARPGDRLLVTGTLGGAALARARAERGAGRVRRVPIPRLEPARTLSRILAVTSCIDISDGLGSDLRQLLGDELHADLDPRRIPRPARFGRGCAELGLAPERLILTGGEDYELLFTVRAAGPAAGVLSRRLGVRVTEIGEVRRGAADPGAPGGWQHF